MTKRPTTRCSPRWIKTSNSGSKSAPLTDVIDFLADQLNTPCRIDGHALDEEGIARDTPVTYKSAGQPAKHALSAILAQLELDWIVDRGAVVITTRGKCMARSARVSIR